VTTAVDGAEFSNISATTAVFALKGGFYVMAAVATFGGGSVELQMLGPDQSTFLTTPAAYPVGATMKLSAAGAIQGYLAPGQYKFVVVTASAVYCSVMGIPIS
jgi:hypothetical protein